MKAFDGHRPPSPPPRDPRKKDDGARNHAGHESANATEQETCLAEAEPLRRASDAFPPLKTGGGEKPLRQTACHASRMLPRKDSRQTSQSGQKPFPRIWRKKEGCKTCAAPLFLNAGKAPGRAGAFLESGDSGQDRSPTSIFSQARGTRCGSVPR